MATVLYSTDYELFLGANFVPERKVLIEPTERLLSAYEALGAPLTLFADVASIWRHRELQRDDFPRLAESQMQEAIRRGHDVQTHLHPHWLFASPDGGAWSFPPAKYLLGNIAADAEDCYRLSRDLLLRCKRYLESLLQQVDANYRCIAYRAGGYGVQPNDRAIFSALTDAGFLIDSSIVPGMRLLSKVHEIDFRGVPHQPNYRIACTGINTAAVRGVYEIPVIAGRMSPAGYMRALLAYARSRRPSSNAEWRQHGRGVLQIEPETTGRLRRILRSTLRKLSLLSRRWEMLALSDDAAMMFSLTKSYIGRFASGPVYFSMISHPKTLTSAMLRALGEYHKKMHLHYGSGFRALSFQAAAAEVNRDTSPI
jgi:hypothetical protein